MTLYQIDNIIANFVPEVDEFTGELLNADLLERLQMDRTDKLESIALYIKNLDAEAEAIKGEVKNLAERQKQKERQRDSMKRYLENALAGEKFETSKCAVSYRKTAKVVTGDNFMVWATLHAPELIRSTVKTEPDKDAIKAAIKSGQNVVGAEIVESRSMTVK